MRRRLSREAPQLNHRRLLLRQCMSLWKLRVQRLGLSYNSDQFFDACKNQTDEYIAWVGKLGQNLAGNPNCLSRGRIRSTEAPTVRPLPGLERCEGAENPIAVSACILNV